MSQSRNEFIEAIARFKKRHNFVVRIHDIIVDRNLAGSNRQARGALAFSRLREVGKMLILLSDPEDISLDPTSFVSVARTLLETNIMFLYVSDLSIPDQEWALREEVLQLHDNLTRYLMLKTIRETEDADALAQLKAMMKSRKEKISDYKVFRTLNEERKKKLLDGQEIYVNGIRSAVQEAGCDLDDFNRMYKFLSAFGHAAPFTFGFGQTVTLEEARFLAAVMALDYVETLLLQSCKRMCESYPDVFMEGVIKH